MYSAVRRLPGRMPGMKPPVALDVLGHVDRIDDDRRVEVAEEDDQNDVDEVVEQAAGFR